MIDPNHVSAMGWDRFHLSCDDRDMLDQHAAGLEANPYTDLMTFRAAAADAWNALSNDLRDRVSSLASDSSSRPELYLSGLPTPHDLGATPAETVGCVRTSGFVSEFLTMVLCAGLGAPISYRDQRNGSVFHDIFPTRANALAVSSQSSSTSLGFHTEMFFHPQPPDFLLLHCLRADPAGVASTSVAARADIAAALTETDRELLAARLYAMDLHRLHGSYVCNGRPISASDPRPVFAIYPSDVEHGCFRFEPELTTALSDEALDAMHRADEAARKVSRTGRLEPGGMLLVDNRRAVHSRSEFPARFDGSDRWLRRVMIGRSDKVTPVVHRRHDLELARAWSSIASLAVVPAVSAVAEVVA